MLSRRARRRLLGLATVITVAGTVLGLAACSGSGQPAPTPRPAPPATSSSVPACAGGQCAARPADTGFRGDRSALTTVPGNTVPAGCAWVADIRTLECHRDAVLDHVDVQGAVDAYGSLTITDSVVTAGSHNWMLVNERSSSGRCTVRDSTLRFDAGGSYPLGMTSWGVAGINDMNGCRGDYEGNDISGTPDGIDTGTPGSVIRGNWIHDLAALGTPPEGTHNDGVQLFGCSRCEIVGNTIDIGWDGVHQNAAVFASDGPGGEGIVVRNNYLAGGGITLRNEVGRDMTVVGNTFRLLPRQFGPTSVSSGASFATWSRNTTTGGAPVPEPAP